MLEQGATEDQIVKQARQMNMPIPAQILNAPQLMQGGAFYLEAFLELSADRAIGMGIGRIPRTSIMQFAREEGVTGSEDIQNLKRFVWALDNEYIKHANREAEKKGKTK